VNLTQNVVEDGEALLQIKATILADPLNVTYWWKRSGAKKTLNPCKVRNDTALYWPGINCTNKRVSSINLSNMSLTGTLSPYLGTITFLKSVDLSNNLFTGAIPGDLTSAAYLETLNLANNRLDGLLPASLGNWTNLTSLNVANNGLVGQIPASIGNLQLLETLNMTGNNLTGAIPQELNRCGRLSEVDLSRNGLQGIVPFQNLTNLTVLHLQENQLAGDFVTTRLETLIRLADLDLSNNQLNGTIPATISNVPLRNQLSLGHNNLSGEIPDALGNLSLVLRIDLSVNNLTGASPDSVGRLLSLQELNVSLNELHGGIPMSLALLPSLVVLDASRNHLGGLLPGFSGIKSLRVFDASYNSLTGPIPNNFVDFAALQYLNVSYNDLHGEVPVFVEHTGVNRESFVHTEVCGVIIGVDCNPPPSGGHQSTVISIAVGSAVAFVVMFIIVYVLCTRHYEKEKQHKKFATVSAEFELKLTPEQVLRATKNFSERSKIGQGSMSAVYRGVLPGDGAQVAVKKLAIRRGDLHESSEKVLGDGFETLGHVRHWSLVKVLGYCCSPDITALVMEYMPNGTLSNVMYPMKRDTELAREFNWNDRFNTAIGVAEGLKYLHHECPTPTVHGDLKPSNILFNIFMEARITDFGVAKLLADHGLGPRPTLEAGYDNSYKAPGKQIHINA
jgi:LRR receptor-like serine/threonine-protein kinase FLS2